MLGGMGIQICSNKGAWAFWGKIRGKNIKLIMNYWPECLDIWYESSFGRGDSSLFK